MMAAILACSKPVVKSIMLFGCYWLMLFSFYEIILLICTTPVLILILRYVQSLHAWIYLPITCYRVHVTYISIYTMPFSVLTITDVHLYTYTTIVVYILHITKMLSISLECIVELSARGFWVNLWVGECDYSWTALSGFLGWSLNGAKMLWV